MSRTKPVKAGPITLSFYDHFLALRLERLLIEADTKQELERKQQSTDHHAAIHRAAQGAVTP